MNWYLEPLKKYAVFIGRSRRKEYWVFVLTNLFVALILIGIQASDANGSTTSVVASAVAFLFQLAIFLPTVAVGVRRLHDIDRSGWWLLIGLVPIVGPLILIIFAVLPGTKGINRFGEDPINSRS